MWGRDFEKGDGKYKNPKYIHTTRRGNCKDFGCYEQNLEEIFYLDLYPPFIIVLESMKIAEKFPFKASIY